MAAKRILVVDDDSYVRGATEEILIRKGYEVDTAPEAASALRKLEEGDYDLLLSDIKMPGMSGGGLFGIITRNRPDLAERVLFVTGDTVSPRTRDFLASTGRPWLNKPVHLQELASEVAMVCEAESALEQSRPQGAGR